MPMGYQFKVRYNRYDIVYQRIVFIIIIVFIFIMPIQGRIYREGDPYYSVFSSTSGTYKEYKFKYSEAAICGIVRIVDEGGENAKIVGFYLLILYDNPYTFS